MKRWEFTKNLIQILFEMELNGHKPIIDFALRSTEEQKRLFDKGLSKCDGSLKISNHQRGLAADIYLTDSNGNIQFDWDKDKADYYHNRWIQLGGKPMIIGDSGHFDA